MTNLILFLTILNLKISFANETDVVIKTNSCGASCSDLEISNAVTEAETKAMNYFTGAANVALSNQSSICLSQVSVFNSKCNSGLFNEIKINIESIKKNIETKISVLESFIKVAGIESNIGSDTSKTIAKLNDLKNEISSEKELILTQHNALVLLNNACDVGFKEVNFVCSPPTVRSNGDTTVISLKSSAQPERVAVQKASGDDGFARAEALVTMNGELDAPAIDSKRAEVESQYTTTSRVGGATFEAVNGANSFADDSITNVENIINSLKPLTLGNQTGSCVATFANPCPPEESDDAINASARPQARPLGLTASGDDKVNGSATPGDGGASAEEVMSSAQDSAYGGSPTVNVNTTNTGSAAPQGGGAGGGFAGALSGLSSMLGKATGGAFGDSSSYSNNYGSSRYGANARTNSGGSYPTESYDYNSANQKTANGGVQQPRGFQPQAGGLPSNNGFNPNAGAQGGAGSGLSGSSSSGSGGTNADKPSLFSRLFGKKDKTLFSNKSSGGGGGGSFGGASSKTGYSPTGASLDSNGLQDSSNPNGGRSFDPSKYMPSKAAEERAYLRSTGRKIASHSLGDGSANDFQWPNDISRNKNMNLFKTVNIIHRAKLSQ